MGVSLPVLAAFVSPGLFVGGAAAVSLPILIHILARRRFKRIRWAAMEFLVDAEHRNRRRIFLEEWILLALRCLAVLAVAAMIARPFFQPGGLAGALAGSRQTERVFVIDDSYSMAYRRGDRTVFDDAQLAVRKLIDMIRAETPDDTVTILRMTEPASPVESGTWLSEGQTDQLFQRLAALQPSNKSMDVSSAVTQVADYLTGSEGVVSAAVYFVSDFQQPSWLAHAPAGTGPDAGKGVWAPLEEWAAEDRALKLVCVNVADPSASNATVADVELNSGRPVVGASGRLAVTVVNHSEEPASEMTLQATLGQRLLPAKSLGELAPGLRSVTEMDVEFQLPGYVPVRVQSPEDRLALDDTRYLVTEVASSLKVLVVNGEPGADLVDDEVGLLATALRPQGEVYSGHDVMIVDEAELEDTSLSDFHVVVLANVYRLSTPTVESLERFTSRGGGLLIFLGDQVDPDIYNASLYRDGEGLLPLPMSADAARSTTEFHLVFEDRLHPMLRTFARDGDPLGIGRIPFFAFARLDESAERLDDGAEAREHEPRYDVPIRFDDADKSPALVEQRFGQGRVLVLATSADKEWSLWPDHPAYLPMVSEMVRYLARSRGAETSFVVGEPIEIPMDPARVSRDAVLRTPAFPEEREYNITAAEAREGEGLSFNWPGTDLPGIYELTMLDRDGGEFIRRVAVNADPAEGDLATCDRSSLASVAGGMPFEYVEGLDALSSQAGEGRTEIWRFMLVAALLLLMVEQFLAWRWGGGRWASRAAAPGQAVARVGVTVGGAGR